ncbi:MAG: hypothetical protein Unbinned4409contig1001_36 [Prokaryotic dsDNA virus sp.]|nr:MAG: hypothetical protein Unbinned4409contig1001_36 [Prokaryotic dsDNA virus sp.]|tara:strand:- start:21731 stop:22843 length:1113 start_codon:yes stop_codon:yes gene_type:complete
MTISYDPSSGKWKSRYSYDTSCIDFQDNVMLSFNTVSSDGEICYEHNANSAKNTFYGSQEDSEVKLSFNANPSSNKVYKALSLEGSNLSSATSQLTANLSPDFDQRGEARVNEGFIEKGGIFYGGITKVRSSDNENGLKVVGEITAAQYLDNEISSNYVINNGQFPFIGIDLFDQWWTYIFFNLIPSPHYRVLDSASADDVISKYYVGWQTNTGELVVTPFLAQALPLQEDLSNFVFTSNNSLNALSDRIDNANSDDFESLSDGVHNTDTNAKLGNNILAARVTSDVVEGNLLDNQTNNDVAARFILAMGINNYLAEGNRLFIYKITDDRIDGSDPMGQYADVTLSLGSLDFELFAVNAEYTTTTLDHSK